MICMCVCVCVCMYICMYVCTYVRTYICMYVSYAYMCGIGTMLILLEFVCTYMHSLDHFYIIRAAALKTLFPSDTGGGDSSSRQSPMEIDANKKFSTSTATHYRSCPECSQPNPRSAKKCQKCQKPLQGKACPQCGQPNHSWVPSCYKCGTSLPSYLGKTGKRNTSEVLVVNYLLYFTL